MQPGRIVLAGATGFIGRPLVRALLADGHEVACSRGGRVRPAFLWERGPCAGTARTVDGWGEELAGAAAVVNLAGASVGRFRWTHGRKRGIVGSRVETTRALVEAMERLAPAERPRVLANSSGVDYAGDCGDAVVTEESPPGETFLARVCVEWEAAALGAVELGVRVVRLRTPLTIGRGAPALRLLALPFRLFADGPLGHGRQWFPWVHLDDAVAAYRRAVDDERLRGLVNVVAPGAIRQRDAARELGAVLGRPSWLPTPKVALRAVLGEQADLLLHGQRAVPAKLTEAGFRLSTPLSARRWKRRCAERRPRLWAKRSARRPRYVGAAPCAEKSARRTLRGKSARHLRRKSAQNRHRPVRLSPVA